MPEAKYTKGESNYEMFAKGKDICAYCEYFIPPHGCEKVKGFINAGGWCKFFEKEEK